MLAEKEQLACDLAIYIIDAQRSPGTAVKLGPLDPVYTIQPVEQPVEGLFTRCSRLFNRLFSRFDSRLRVK